MIHEKNLDKILFECQNHIHHENDELSKDNWRKIAQEISDNNTNEDNITCPIFMIYINKLLKDELIYAYEPNFYKAMGNGILHRGFVCERRIRIIKDWLPVLISILSLILSIISLIIKTNT